MPSPDRLLADFPKPSFVTRFAEGRLSGDTEARIADVVRPPGHCMRRAALPRRILPSMGGKDLIAELDRTACVWAQVVGVGQAVKPDMSTITIEA